MHPQGLLLPGYYCHHSDPGPASPGREPCVSLKKDGRNIRKQKETAGKGHLTQEDLAEATSAPFQFWPFPAPGWWLWEIQESEMESGS